jgi:hypothetical protein
MAETEKGVGAEPRDVGAQLVGPGDFAAGSRTRWGDQKEAQWMMDPRNWGTRGRANSAHGKLGQMRPNTMVSGDRGIGSRGLWWKADRRLKVESPGKRFLASRVGESQGLVSENGAQPKGCRRNTTERGRGCLSCFRGNATRDCRGRAPDRGHTAVAVGGRAWETQRKRKQMLVSLTKQRTQRSANWDAKQRGKIWGCRCLRLGCGHQTPLAQCRTGGRPPCANEYISFFAAAAQGEGGATAAQRGIRNGGPRWNRWIRCAGPGGCRAHHRGWRT